MGLANYPHSQYVKLSNEMHKVTELLCRVLCKKIWLLLLIHLKQWSRVKTKENAELIYSFLRNKIHWYFLLTYLIYLYKFLIRWNKSISCNALVMTKILIIREWHLYFVFSGSDSVYFTSFRFVPRECWCRKTIRKTLQSHRLANPRLLRWRGDIFNCGRV